MSSEPSASVRPRVSVSAAAGLLAEFERRLREQTSSSEGFAERFSELSRNNDRPGMVGCLLSAALSSCPIGESFRAKDEARAATILEEMGPVCESSLITAVLNVDKVTAVLTEALLSAPARSPLFFQVLLQRARAWYRSGELLRCGQDCRLFCEKLASMDPQQDDDWTEESRVDALLMLSDCLKRENDAAEARNALNEAMHRIDHLARRRCLGAEPELFKIEKAQLLKDFLEKKQSLALSQRLLDAASRSRRATANQIRIPTVHGAKPNDFLTSCSDALALGSDEAKGRKLYATRDIKPGTVLIVDRPFASTTDVAALCRNCLCCHASLKLPESIRVPCEHCQAVQFCSEDCRRRAWNKFHKYECRIFDYFYAKQAQKTNCLLAYRAVVAAALRNEKEFSLDQEFLKLHENDKDSLDIASLASYESRDYKTVFSLESHCADADPADNLQRAIHSVFFAKSLIYSLNYFHPEIDNHERHLHILAVALLHNMQAIKCNAYEIVENVRDDETKILEPRNVGGAIYTTVSLTNHSCYPNIVRHSFPNGTVVVTSLRYIPEGSEILDCYGQHFLENKRDSRRRLLAEKYYFDCQCEPCLADWPIVLPSDQFNFKCKKCFKKCRRTRNATECVACGQKTETSKLYASLQNSMKKRLAALTKMYDGHYEDALPLLLEHANCIDKILSEPSLEAVKTQQSIIQCLNAMSSTSV